MHSSSLTSKGQVTIPSEIREKLGLKAGDKVGFVVEGNHVLVFKKQKNVEAAFGLLKPKSSASLKEIEEAIHKGGSNAGG